MNSLSQSTAQGLQPSPSRHGLFPHPDSNVMRDGLLVLSCASPTTVLNSPQRLKPSPVVHHSMQSSHLQLKITRIKFPYSTTHHGSHGSPDLCSSNAFSLFYFKSRWWTETNITSRSVSVHFRKTAALNTRIQSKSPLNFNTL